MKANHIKQQQVAKIIGRSLSATNRKINNYTDFTKREIQKLHDLLNIPIDVII
ncbi:helix-turn-helix domain-containing protein [Bombilactobacillus bombi]|uniref:helix-turn-helix domain-containing protein n=1 Tax=Bombilactobacillus bombi TaxID=1303590 RepID=UPI002175355D|nr:helix-turn-helix transcriptional regulator [Bombilactobacillus bombi]